MCGICFCLFGARPGSHLINFNPFDQYVSSAFVQQHPELRDKYFGAHFDYLQYMQSRNLFMRKFSLFDVAQKLRPRGPDGFRALQLTRNIKKQTTDSCPVTPAETDDLLQQGPGDGCYKMVFSHSLLHLRGQQHQPVFQPLACNSQVLLYNGEIYKIKRDTCLLGDKSPVHFDAYENDTLQLLDILHLHSQRFRAGAGGSVDQAKCGEAYWAGLQQILSNTIGDFALVYYDALNQKLVIAKDVFGKRSLLLGFSECGFAISSRAINEQGEEVGIGPEKDKEEDEENTKNDADQAEYIEKKYFHEFLHSKDKCWLELPSNSCIIIDIHENQQDGTVKLIWNRHTINAQLLLRRNLALDADKSPLKPNMSIPSELVDAVFAQLLKSTKRVVKHIFAFKQHFQAKKKGTTTHQASEESKQASDGEQQLKQAKIDTSCQRTKANIAILFSGGLDSALLTRLIDILIPPEEE